jgi:hypothetical protein
VRPLTAAAATILAGAGVGAATRLTDASPAHRAVLALLVCLGLASCLAVIADAGGASVAARWRHGALIAAAAFASAWAGAAAAGVASLVGGGIAVAGAAVLACGSATLLAVLGRSRGRARFAAAALPLACGAIVFVADPLIEWRGASTEEAPARAAAVVAVSPIASIAADAGVDWQRGRWMYDGPRPGAGSLSVIGPYYPSRPTPAWLWGAAAAALGFAALAAARPAGRIPA